MRVAQTRVITGMVMPGGWHFFQALNGIKTRVPAGSYEELLEAVRLFRMNNRLPVGDVQGDVDDYVCTTFPRQCRGSGKPTINVSTSVPTSLQVRFVDKVMAWATGLLHTPPVELVPAPEAEERAAKCVKCPNNVDWRSTVCSKCDGDAQRLLLLLRKSKDSSQRDALLGCKLHSHDNRTAVWLHRKQPRHAGSPQQCWV